MTDDGQSMLTISFKCSRSLWERVKAYAARNDRGYSSVVRMALARFVGGTDRARAQGRPNGRQTVKCV